MDLYQLIIVMCCSTVKFVFPFFLQALYSGLYKVIQFYFLSGIIIQMVTHCDVYFKTMATKVHNKIPYIHCISLDDILQHCILIIPGHSFAIQTKKWKS